MNGLQSSSRASKAPHRGSLTVLVVDDHEVFRQGLLNLVKSVKGFHVIADVGTLHDALALLKTMHVDLVLLDLSLPDCGGVEAVHLLKKAASSLSIIVISASMDDDTLLDVVSAGACGYLTKDTFAADMIGALQGFQRGELAMVPAVSSTVVHLLLQHCQVLETELNTYLQAGIKAFEAEQPVMGDRKDRPNVPQVGDQKDRSNVPLEFPLLTPQEEKVLQLMHHGQSNKQIAAHLYISRFTVGKHVQNILRKLGVANRTQAVAYTSFEGGSTV